jgi:putative ABC transport system substrate-binding protein
MLLAFCFSADAQQSKKIPLIAVLNSASRTSNATNVEAFLEGLRELGYIEGKNITVEYRYADGERSRLATLASELVQLKVDVIVASGTQTAIAARQSTTTIPIVVGEAGDLVATGIVASLARPGGNLTGSTRMAKDLNGKRIELLKEAIPKASRVAVLMSSATTLRDRYEVKEIEPVARHLGLKLQPVDVGDPKEFKNAYAVMIREHADAVIVFQGSFMTFHHKHIVELALKNRLASMCEELMLAEAGCLMSYGPDIPHLWRRAAVFVDKILKGTKPADLPVEQPTKFEFVVNLKTAKQIGVTIPPNVLAHRWNRQEAIDSESSSHTKSVRPRY